MSKWYPPEKPFIILSEQFSIAQSNSKQVYLPTISFTAMDVLYFTEDTNTNFKNRASMNHLVRTPIS